MYLTHRKKLLLCLLVLVLCLWVIYQTSQLALQYDKSMVSLQWEVDRCIHKQGLDPQSRLGPEGLLSHYTLTAYPEGLVSISPAALHHSNKHFTTRAPAHLRDKVSDQLSSLMWPVSVTSDPWPVCTHYHDEGYVFTVSVPDERGWYEHLHTHTLLPLYALLAYRSHTGPHSVDGNSVALLPAVENYELQSVDWGSTVLSEEHGVVQEMLKTFAGSVKILPLSESTLHHSEHTTCFMTLHLGVGSVNLRDPSLLSGFVELVLSRLSLPLTTPTQPLLCLAVGGLLTQRILNAPQLLEAVRGGVAAQILDFSGLSYREQVSQTQLCTIMAGFHGDDLVNALYMSADSVTILLRPLIHSEEQPNVYSDLARARGHYMEWTNPIEDTHRPGNGPTNTEVDVDTFVELIDNALTLGINSRLLRT